MLYWDTGDRVVDVLLRRLEGFSTWHLSSDADAVQQLLQGLIPTVEMLPKSVSANFSLPHLHIGNAHFEYGQDYRTSFVERVSLALREGLENCEKDAALKKAAATDFSDRPKSRGEVILKFVAAFREEPSSDKLADLELSVSHTSLQHRVREIRMLFTRKRPYGNQEPQVAMYGELLRLETDAEGYFGQKA